MKIASERLDANQVRVRLVAPKEPLAWAIDPAFAPGGPFHSAWHSERVPGVRSRPAAEEAIVPFDGRAKDGARLAVRVFTDEGAVVTEVLAP